MRLASSILASLALHAGVLAVLPVTHVRVPAHELIPVLLMTAVESHDESAGLAAPARGGGRLPVKSRALTPPNDDGRSHDETPPTRASNSPSSPPAFTTALEGSVPVTESSGSDGIAAVDRSAFTAGFSGAGAGGGDGQPRGGGRGDGLGGNGQGGSGSGGSGGGGGAHKQLMATYRTTAKPDYPERARREGKEGRVMLRVLVDVEGRCEIVQIDTSSGSELLDQAARDAVKRWRFSPARDGDKAVPSWVKIPIDFRLSDARNLN